MAFDPQPPSPPPTLAYRDRGAARSIPSAPSRPTAVTVLAIVGIVLASILLLLTGYHPYVKHVTPPPLYGRPLPQPESWTIEAGQALGHLLRSGALFLMLIGCCGLLANRRPARIIVVVASLAWVILGALGLFILYFGAMSMAALGGPGFSGGIVVGAVIIVLTEVAFPIWALVTLRTKTIVEFYAARPPADPGGEGVPRLWRAIAIAGIVVASLWILEGAVTLIHLSSTGESAYVAPQLLPINHHEYEPTASVGAPLLDASLWTLLNGALFTGCLLLLMRRRRPGAVMVLVYVMVRLAILLGTWGPPGNWHYIARHNSDEPGVAQFIDDSLSTLAGRAHSAVALVVLLIVFTQRIGSKPPSSPTAHDSQS